MHASARIAALTALLAVACDDRPPEPAEKRARVERQRGDDGAPHEPAPPGDARTDDAPSSDDARSCSEIGWRTVPAIVSDAARATNEAALAHHRAGRYEAALEGFRGALELEPDYDAARFDVACALSRLGRAEAAMREVRQLLCRDLPTFGPKALADEDLTAIRPEIRAAVHRIEPAFRRAMREGAPLVAYRDTRVDEQEPSRHWSQAVVYRQDAPHPIVPIGPRVSSRGRGLRAVATHADVARGRVLTVSYAGNSAEMAYISSVRVRLFEAPSGVLQIDAHGPTSPPFVEAGLTDRGVVLATLEPDGPTPVTWTLEPEGARRRGGELPAVHLRAGQAAWTLQREPEEWSIARGRLVGPGVDIPLGEEHRRMQHHALRVAPDGSVAVALAAEWGNCGFADRFALDVIDVRARRVERRLEGEGQILFELGPDGALFVQVRDGLRRYPRPLDDRYETLPDGLGLSSMPWDFNPYC